MTVYQRGETHVHHVTIRDSTGVKTTPTSVKETIYDPCGKVLLRSTDMTATATGEYYYNYALISTATYGRYVSEATAKDSSGYISKDRLSFYVMPWDAVEDIRLTMGVENDSKSVSDDAIAYAAWTAYKDALNQVHTHHYNEPPNGNPYTGAMWDGSNTIFKTKTYPIADYNGDGTVTGWGTSCATDVSCSWIDYQGVSYTAYAAVTNAGNGEITIKKSNGVTAIPANAQAVYLDYWEEPANYDDTLFRQAAVYLACHLLSKRLVNTDRVTIADLQRNNPVIVLNPTMWKQEYDRLLRRLRGPSLGGVTG